jgi:hypothetical protein
MPLLANYSLEGLKKELPKFGIVLLEEFADGQVRWGDRPLPKDPKEKFKGRSVMTAPYLFRDGRPRFHIFTIRNIFERLGKVDHLEKAESQLHEYMY